MPTFKIEVPTVITHVYTVTADSEEQALEMYHAGADGVTFEEDDSSNSEETIGFAAVTVYMRVSRAK